MTLRNQDGDKPANGKVAKENPGAEKEGQSDGLLQKIKSLFGFANQVVNLRESLKGVIDEHVDAGSADRMTVQERAMLLNILSFGSLRVEDVMVPRADIIAVDEEESLEEILKILAEEGHSRVPVYRETLDDPVGMYHIKDLLPFALKQMRTEEGGAAQWLSRERREMLFVPPSMAVLDLFLKMQATRVHMALVIDEYGGTDGLVTIEDLVEEIVGEIEDEHDVEEGPLLSEETPGRYLADARLQIEDLIEVLGQKLLLEDSDDDIDTLGGLIFDLAGRVPQRGELIQHPAGFEFEIVDADARRIKKVRIKSISERKAPASDKNTETPQSDDADAGGTDPGVSPPVSGAGPRSVREA